MVIHNAVEKLPIPIYGNGKNVRDWIYVKDHCDAIFNILQNGKIGKVYNIGSKNKITNIELVNRICSYLNLKMPNKSSYHKQIKFVEDRLGHDFAYAIDTSQMKNELNWSASKSFDKGLYETIDWYLENLKWLKLKRKHIILKL